MYQYEMVFIVNPLVLGDDVQALKKDIVSFMKKNKCDIIHEQDWGSKELAYPIQKHTRGTYFVIQFKAKDGNFVAKLDVKLRREEKIIRFLISALDKFALDYLEKKRTEKTELVEEIEAAKTEEQQPEA